MVVTTLVPIGGLILIKEQLRIERNFADVALTQQFCELLLLGNICAFLCSAYAHQMLLQ